LLQWNHQTSPAAVVGGFNFAMAFRRDLMCVFDSDSVAAEKFPERKAVLPTGVLLNELLAAISLAPAMWCDLRAEPSHTILCHRCFNS
jgi:hypothetical protein